MPKKLDADAVRRNIANPDQADWRGLDPKDVRMSMGPIMTDAQMIEFCRKNGIQAPSILGRVEAPATE